MLNWRFTRIWFLKIGISEEVACYFNAGKTQMVPLDQSNNTEADVVIDGSILEEKSSIFQDAGVDFSSKLDWGL